jgi:hypothetical protein
MEVMRPSMAQAFLLFRGPCLAALPLLPPPTTACSTTAATSASSVRRSAAGSPPPSSPSCSSSTSSRTPRSCSSRSRHRCHFISNVLFPVRNSTVHLLFGRDLHMNGMLFENNLGSYTLRLKCHLITDTIFLRGHINWENETARDRG